MAFRLEDDKPGSQNACILENQSLTALLAFRPPGIPAFKLNEENR